MERLNSFFSKARNCNDNAATFQMLCINLSLFFKNAYFERKSIKCLMELNDTEATITISLEKWML